MVAAFGTAAVSWQRVAGQRGVLGSGEIDRPALMALPRAALQIRLKNVRFLTDLVTGMSKGMGFCELYVLRAVG